MSEDMNGVVLTRDWGARGMLTFWCPGCLAGHTIFYGDAETWTWNGSYEKPTISPSVLVYPHARSFDESDPDREGPVPDQPRCHSFVEEGVIRFLGDSEHALAGQSVELGPIPERYRKFLEH